LNAGLLNMVIDPSEKNRLKSFKFLTFQTFIVVYQRRQDPAQVQCNETEKSNSNDLQQQSQHQMGISLLQVMCIDVDDVAPDGLQGDERKCQVFELCVSGQVLFVDYMFVDGIRS
jgi:hypothetical protein